MSFFLRLFIAALVLAALPLQGFAAASMWRCLPSPVSATADRPASHGHPHDTAHAQGQGHAHQEPPAAFTSIVTHAAADQAVAAADGDHRCGACAFCGHGLAVLRTAVSLSATTAPEPPRIAPAPRIADDGRPVPDKPPRA